MSDISFLAIPNIVGLRFAWYLQVIGSVLLFGVCLFFVLYFLSLHRKKKAWSRKLQDIDQQSWEVEKQLFQENICTASGKRKLVLFIEYLEKFVTIKPYSRLFDLLVSQGFSPQDAEECEHILYQDQEMSHDIHKKIDEILMKIVEK